MDNVKIDIMSTNAGINPVGAIFNVYAGKFEDFISDFLTQQGITGVQECKLYVRNMNSSHAIPVFYVFMRRDTNVVSCGKNRLPDYLKGKVEGSNQVRVSDTGREKFATVANVKHLNTGTTPEGDVFVELDIFRALGLLLKASYKQHKLTIFDINLVNDEIVLTVIKQETPKVSFGTGKSDKRAAFIERQTRSRY